MNDKIEMQTELNRYYSLWKDGNAMYEEWAKSHGLSSNVVLVLYSFFDGNEIITQKSISKKWCIPKQTVNTILKDFTKKGYIEMYSLEDDKRNKAICLTESGKDFASKIINELRKKEEYVTEKTGIEKLKQMNDTTELFIKYFREEV